MIGSRFPRISPAHLSRTVGVRTRLLAIVLIPSIALLATGIGGAVYLVRDGQKANDWAELADATGKPVALMVQAFQEERRISLLHLAGDGTAVAHLPAARKQSDVALAAVHEGAVAARKLRPDTKDELDDYRKLFDKLTQLRGGIDARMVPTALAFDAFNKVIDTVSLVVLLAADIAPDAKVAVELYKSTHLLRAAESLSRITSLGSVALLTEQLPAAQIPELARYIGDARGEVSYLSSVLTGARQEELKQLVASTEWQRNVAMENALVQRGPVAPKSNTTTRTSRTEPAALPMDVTEWQQVAGHVRGGLLKVWVDQTTDAQTAAQELGARLAKRSMLGGAAVLAVTLIAFLAALLLANRFVGRMKRLRRDTLELADERLPETIRQLSSGQELDAVDELAKLDYGADEIGQVADAFNRAHHAAVSAAVAESKTRAGVNAVFLNIAHRSQVVVHRQLVLLDKAEREEEDPQRLDLLFQLDHLATRSRRNAENLIILGGEQPGRKWRNPVPLVDVIRGAVAESLDYTRIDIGQLPQTQITGSAVADMIHLLAELADNATAYSPPEAKVEITGNLVGKGVAVEISDQGLGMSVEEFGERNTLLANPPDFSVAALSSDARLGLFVVAKLASRHGISVRLAESDYGGVKAIVLIPVALTTSELEPGPSASRPALTGGAEYALTGQVAAVGKSGSFDAFGTGGVIGGAELPARTSGLVRSEAYGQSAASSGEGPGTGQLPSFGPRESAGLDLPAISNPAETTGRHQKPDLPRRRRTTAGPAESTPALPEPPPTPRQRSAEEARNLMSAIENGTKQGRLNRVDSDQTPSNPDLHEGRW
ncbi:nitrate- and nitrite sensing domain-containing protein [Nocardia sp. XZ_19_385]|uniref:sensor histidine kinase n=1 Tax=Nocardia sp. XZ_19_385 TaxID=2769488 RepID=UPI00281640DB|nr:nitrate- and nitrite sensing domain-containing protein [Nocardia sp. XZ_19_385]